MAGGSESTGMLRGIPDGPITNSDLEMTGMLLLWLVIELTISDLESKHFGLC